MKDSRLHDLTTRLNEAAKLITQDVTSRGGIIIPGPPAQPEKPCLHNHADVFLFEQHPESYTIIDGKVVDSDTDLAAEPVHVFEVYCQACQQTFRYDLDADTVPAWARPYYVAVCQRHKAATSEVAR